MGDEHESTLVLQIDAIATSDLTMAERKRCLSDLMALVKAAQDALEDFEGTLESEWGPIERWPESVLALRAALVPFTREDKS
jgi:hypothetical protein